MNNKKVLDWLFNNSNSIIKYLLIKNFGFNADINKYKKEVLQNEHVIYWINNLLKITILFRIHDSFDYCYENSMGKLLLFGISNEINGINKINKFLLEKLIQSIKNNQKVFKYHWGDEKIVTAYLSKLGFYNNYIIKDYIQKRLDDISYLIDNYGFNIYVDKTNFKKIPSAFKKYKLVNPEISNEKFSKLPGLFDMILFQSILIKDSELNNKKNLIKLDKILMYIFNPEYQELYRGYGIQWHTGNKYYAIGWKVHLPFFFNKHIDVIQMQTAVLYVEILSNYPFVIKADWFKKIISHFESFRTKDDTYIFPKEYLQEKRDSYFILGGHMGLGENRRKKIWNEIESTFWMLKIKNNIEKNK